MESAGRRSAPLRHAGRSLKAVSSWGDRRLRSALRWIPVHRRSVSVALALSVTLTLVALRDFLFGSGYYEYADQKWPVNGAVWPTGYFAPAPLTSNGGFYIFQFSRDFITFPIGLFHLLSLNSLLQEKLFFLYSFVLFVLLAYVFAALIVRYALQVLGRQLSGWSTEIARVLIVVALFTNLYFIYLVVDGGTVTEGLIAIFLGISALLLLCEEDFVLALAVTVILTSLGFLLDPVDAVTVLVVLGLSLVYRSVSRRDSLLVFFKQVGYLLLAFAPTALFLVFFFYPTLGTPSGGGSDYPIRVFDLAGIQGFAYNTTILNVLRLTGYFWNTVTLAPPSILWYHGAYSQLPGLESPTTLLLPPGELTQFWLLTLYAPVTIALGSLLVRRLWRLTIPFATVLVVCVVLTQWPWYTASADLVSAMASIPLLGPLIGETMYFPYIFMLGESVAILVLAGAAIVALLSGEVHLFRTAPRPEPDARRAPSTPAPHTPRFSYAHFRTRVTSRRINCAVVVVIAALLVFPGWQALDGSYSPSRAWSPYVAGNGVPNAGPFEPVNPPPGVESLYNYLYAQPGEFNIYWPTLGANASDFGRGVFFFDQSSSPKPMSSLAALPYLVAHSETGALLAYLQSQNVRYVVVQNSSPIVLAQEYGLDNYSGLLNLFGSIPGIVSEPGLSAENLTVFQVTGTWGATYPVAQLLNVNPGDSNYPVAYSVDRELNQTPALLDGNPANATLAIDSLAGDQSILSPGSAQNITGVGSVAAASLNLSLVRYSTVPRGPTVDLSADTTGVNESIVQTPGTTIDLGNWSLVNQGPSNVNVTIQDGTIDWTSLGATTITLTVGPLLTVGPAGVEIADPGNLSSASTLNVSYRTSPSFVGSLSAYLRDETTNSSVAQVPLSTSLATSQAVTLESFGAATLPWTRYFQPCFQASLDGGSVEVALANYSWNQPSLSFGYHVDTDTESLGPWALTNWTSPNPMYYDFENGQLDVASPAGPGTFTLNFGPLLTVGYGGVPNPEPGAQGVVITMHLTYRTSSSFSAQLLNLASYYQISNSSSAPAIGVNGPSLPASTTPTTVNYSFTAPPSTRNFTMRLQAIGFQGSFELVNVSFSWAFLPVHPATPFGISIGIPRNQTLTWPSRFRVVYADIAGPPPADATAVNVSSDQARFSWYRFSGPYTSLAAGDQLAVVALFTSVPSGSPVALAYTGPYSVDLVLESGGRQYYPYQTVDGNALFLYNRTNAFTIVHSAVLATQIRYFVFLAYLGLFAPLVLWLRQRYRNSSKRRGSPERRARWRHSLFRRRTPPDR